MLDLICTEVYARMFGFTTNVWQQNIYIYTHTHTMRDNIQTITENLTPQSITTEALRTLKIFTTREIPITKQLAD